MNRPAPVAWRIWVANDDGSNPTRLTYFGGPLTGAARWSPDGRQIVFNSRLGGQADLYVISVNGGQPRRLTYDTSNEDLPSWSRDGLWVYFHSDRNGSSQVWKMPSNGVEEPIQVTHTGGLAAFESVDGQFVYYSKGKALGPASLWRVSKDVADGMRLKCLSLLLIGCFQRCRSWDLLHPAWRKLKRKVQSTFLVSPMARVGKLLSSRNQSPLVLPFRMMVWLFCTQVDRDDNDLMLAETLR